MICLQKKSVWGGRGDIGIQFLLMCYSKVFHFTLFIGSGMGSGLERVVGSSEQPRMRRRKTGNILNLNKWEFSGNCVTTCTYGLRAHLKSNINHWLKLPDLWQRRHLDSTLHSNTPPDEKLCHFQSRIFFQSFPEKEIYFRSNFIFFRSMISATFSLKGNVQKKKQGKKLTSVSFAFTHTCIHPCKN